MAKNSTVERGCVVNEVFLWRSADYLECNVENDEPTRALVHTKTLQSAIFPFCFQGRPSSLLVVARLQLFLSSCYFLVTGEKLVGGGAQFFGCY